MFKQKGDDDSEEEEIQHDGQKYQHYFDNSGQNGQTSKNNKQEESDVHFI